MEKLNRLICITIKWKLIFILRANYVFFLAVAVVAGIQLLISDYESRKQLPIISRCLGNLRSHLLAPLKLNAASVVLERAWKDEVTYKRPRRVVVAHDEGNEREQAAEDKAN